MADPAAFLETASDRTVPIDERVRAVEAAAASVTGEAAQVRMPVWGQLFRMCLDNEEPEEVRIAAAWAGRLLRECATNNLVAHAVPPYPRVRSAMIRALTAIGQTPLPTYFESRLSEDLTKLAANASMFPFCNLTLSYGAEPWVVDALRRGIDAADSQIRRSAISQLAAIADMRPAVGALRTSPDSATRADAARALGYYWTGEPVVPEALRQACSDPDAAVAKAAVTALRRLKLAKSPRPRWMRARDVAPPGADPRFPWQPFLRRWSWQMLQVEAFVLHQDDDVVKSGWLGFPPATQSELDSLERRLGRRLPPSYRSFLATTNGFRSGGTSIARIRPAAEVAPFIQEQAQWVDIWTQGHDDEPSLEQHVADRSDCVRGRFSLLRTAIQVSDVSDSSVYLLSPDVVDGDGEWEAWLFATWLPGAVRHPSWWAMMQAEYAGFVTLEKPPEPPADSE